MEYCKELYTAKSTLEREAMEYQQSQEASKAAYTFAAFMTCVRWATRASSASLIKLPSTAPCNTSSYLNFIHPSEPPSTPACPFKAQNFQSASHQLRESWLSTQNRGKVRELCAAHVLSHAHHQLRESLLPTHD